MAENPDISRAIQIAYHPLEFVRTGDLDRRNRAAQERDMTIRARPFHLIAQTLLSLSLPAIAMSAFASDHDTTQVEGLWLTEAKTGTVRISECLDPEMAGTPCGRIETADIPEGEPRTDVNNSDPALRNQPIVGLTMLDGFEKRDTKWKKGRIYNPEDGNSYKSSIQLDEDDPDILIVKGCIAFFCQKQVWTRVEGKSPLKD